MSVCDGGDVDVLDYLRKSRFGKLSYAPDWSSSCAVKGILECVNENEASLTLRLRDIPAVTRCDDSDSSFIIPGGSDAEPPLAITEPDGSQQPGTVSDVLDDELLTRKELELLQIEHDWKEAIQTAVSEKCASLEEQFRSIELEATRQKRSSMKLRKYASDSNCRLPDIGEKLAELEKQKQLGRSVSATKLIAFDNRLKPDHGIVPGSGHEMSEGALLGSLPSRQPSVPRLKRPSSSEREMPFPASQTGAANNVPPVVGNQTDSPRPSQSQSMPGVSAIATFPTSVSVEPPAATPMATTRLPTITESHMGTTFANLQSKGQPLPPPTAPPFETGSSDLITSGLRHGPSAPVRIPPVDVPKVIDSAPPSALSTFSFKAANLPLAAAPSASSSAGKPDLVADIREPAPATAPPLPLNPSPLDAQYGLLIAESDRVKRSLEELKRFEAISGDFKTKSDETVIAILDKGKRLMSEARAGHRDDTDTLRRLRYLVSQLEQASQIVFNIQAQAGLKCSANSDMIDIKASGDNMLATAAAALISPTSAVPGPSDPTSDIIPHNCKSKYEMLMSSLECFEKSFNAFSSDVATKKLRTELSKAINTPINAISDRSISHLEDKMAKIRNVLSGDTIDVGSGSGLSVLHRNRVSIQDHPGAKSYCLMLVAKKIVKQAEEVVSVLPESAFGLAWIVQGLILDHAELKDIVLGTLYRCCPYLVPYYPPKLDGETDLEHFRKLGYLVKDDVSVEKQDKFMKRLSGLVRFFSALVTSPVPAPKASQLSGGGRPIITTFRFVKPVPGQSSSSSSSPRNPYGPEMALALMQNLLAMTPRFDVTATVLYELFVNTGFILAVNYKEEFRKICIALRHDYLPRIEAVSEGGEASYSRLKTRLTEGTLTKPKGYIDYN